MGEPGAFYRGRIDISAVELKKVPSNFKLTSGMTASADMKVGKRRIIDYLLFPIIKGLSSLSGSLIEELKTRALVFKPAGCCLPKPIVNSLKQNLFDDVA